MGRVGEAARAWWFIVSYCAAPAAWGRRRAPTGPVDTGPADAGPAEPAATQSLFRVVNPGFPSSKVTAVALDRGPKYDREDLAPYFGEGTLARARAAFGQGAWTTTRKLLEGTDTPPARVPAGAGGVSRGGPRRRRGRAPRRSPTTTERSAIAAFLHAGWAFEALKRWSAAEHAFERVSRTSRSRRRCAPGLGAGAAKPQGLHRGTRDAGAAGRAPSTPVGARRGRRGAPRRSRHLGCEGNQATRAGGARGALVPPSPGRRRRRAPRPAWGPRARCRPRPW